MINGFVLVQLSPKKAYNDQKLIGSKEQVDDLTKIHSNTVHVLNTIHIFMHAYNLSRNTHLSMKMCPCSI